MEEQKFLFQSLVEKVEQYIKSALELYRLKSIDKSADVVSSLASWMVVLLFALSFFVPLNMGIAFWIGAALGSLSMGFFLVAGFYALISLLFLLFRKKWLKNPLRNAFISQFLK